MFTMDVPYVPLQEAPVVLAQTAAPRAGSISQQPDYILKECQEIPSTGSPKSAMRAVDPATMLSLYLQNRDHRAIDLATRATIKPILLEDPTHGKLTSGVGNDGVTSYGYDPIPGYVGNDKVVFIAEFEGKRYKVVIDLKVSTFVDEKSPTCPQPQLIRVKKPKSGSLTITGQARNDNGPGSNCELNP